MSTRVGITGHQQLAESEFWEWVEVALNKELDALAVPVTAVSSLAIGADQLFASLVVRRGGQLHVVLPFSNYERTFSEENQEIYRQILNKATSVEVLQTLGTDEDAYLAAGRRIVELADLMIAVWDGQPAKGKGGTGDIVSYAGERGVPLIHLNPLSRTIDHRNS